MLLIESIIGKSIIYDLNSDSAYKFERGVDPSNIEFALRRFIKIINDHTKIKKISILRASMQKMKKKVIENNLSKVESILGIDLDKNLYSEILNNLGFSLHEKIHVPSFRHDIEGINDIAEEVARVIGFDNIPKKSFSLNHSSAKQSEEKNRTKSFLVENGFYEIINYPFTSSCEKESISIDNPLDSNKSFMRTSIINSLIENLSYNEKRQKDSIKFFEISNIYTSENPLVHKKRLGLIIGGRRGKNFKDFNTYLDHDYITNILKELGYENVEIQKIPRDIIDSKNKYEIYAAEFTLEDKTNSLSKFDIKDRIRFEDVKFRPISDYPCIIRDLSFLLSGKENIEKLVLTINSLDNEILIEKFIFDFYENEKDGSTKIGCRFVFQSVEKTLTDREVEKVISDIVESTLKISGVSIPGI